jgi:hypothetical protein
MVGNDIRLAVENGVGMLRASLLIAFHSLGLRCSAGGKPFSAVDPASDATLNRSSVVPWSERLDQLLAAPPRVPLP